MASKLSIQERLLRRCLVDFRLGSCFAPLVYRDKKKLAFKNGEGDYVRLLKPARGSSASGPNFQAQPVADLETSVGMNFHQHTGFEQSFHSQRFDEVDFYERHVMGGFQDMVAKYDVAVASTISGAYHVIGTPGTVPGNFSVFTQANAMMNEAGIPTNSRNAVISSNTYGVLADALKGIYRSKSKEDITKGYQGDVMNFRVSENENIPPHTVGSYGASAFQIDGANQTGDTINIKGGITSSLVLNKGDVIHIANVAMIHPITKLPTMRKQAFVVTSPVTTDGTGLASVKINPPINDGTLTTTNKDGQVVSLKAYRNVEAAPADSAPITVWGDSGGTYDQSYFFQKNAIVAQDIQLARPDGISDSNFTTVRDPKTGVTATYIKEYEARTLTDLKRIDLLAAISLWQPEFAVRVFGEKRNLA